MAAPLYQALLPPGVESVNITVGHQLLVAGVLGVCDAGGAAMALPKVRVVTSPILLSNNICFSATGNHQFSERHL